MKKIKLLKKRLTLFLILFLCVNNFAAVVSDNDGRAFITKAEFDSLKNNFQSQIDQYNTSIDAKIDGAIAAYLSEVKIEVSQTLNTVLKDWDKVTMRNYELANNYALPGTSFNVSFYGTGHQNTSEYEVYPSAYGLAAIGKNEKQKSGLKSVGLKVGQEDYYNDISRNKFYWNGFITDYEEDISMSKLGYVRYQDVANAFHNIELRIYNTVNLEGIDDSYYDDISEFWNTKWPPQLQGTWLSSDKTTRVDKNFSPTWSGGFFQWSSRYKNEHIDNKYELTWNAIDENVINPDFHRCFYKFADNPNRSNNVIDAMTISKAGTWLKANSGYGSPVTEIPNHARGTRLKPWDWASSSENKAWKKVFLESHYNPSELNASIYDRPVGSGTTGEYRIPTLGGLGPIGSDDILLQKDDLSYTFKNVEYTKDITTMNEGFPLIYAKKDAKLSWECSFSELHGSTEVESNGEVKIILSYGQFGDESASISGKYVQEDGTMGNAEYVWTTTDKKAKISWTMQEDGWIYAKWFPAALTSSTARTSDAWYVTLDGTNSNKIIFTEKS